MTENKIDLRDVRCPMSTFKLKRYYKTLEPGTMFIAVSDDEDALTDFPAAILNLKGEFVGQEQKDGEYKFTFIKR